MVQPEELQALVKIEHLFGDLMQLKVLAGMTVNIQDSHAGLLKEALECLPHRFGDMEQAEESGRIEAAAVAEDGANNVVVLGSDLLQDVQQRNGRLEYFVRAAHQACCLAELAFADPDAHTFQIEDHRLHHQLRTLMND